MQSISHDGETGDDLKKRWIRLQKNRDFQKVYEKGRFFVHPSLVLYLLRHPGINNGRIGFAAGKKIGNAVQRNRVRRQLKEVVRLYGRLDYFSDCDIIVMIRKPALDGWFHDIREAYTYCEKKAISWLKSNSKA